MHKKNYTLFTILFFSLSTNANGAWTGTWSAAPQPAQKILLLTNQTIREIIHTSIGGESLRVKLSNYYGTESVHLGSAHVALHGNGTAIVPESDRTLSFNGASSITLGPGAEIESDSVDLQFPPMADLAVSLYFPESAPQKTFHALASQTNFISATGDFSAAQSFSPTSTQSSWYFLTGISVSSTAPAIVTIGDSITDGTNSTMDKNFRWPDFLSNRLQNFYGEQAPSVLNEGIAFNQVLSQQLDQNQPSESALKRFAHDVLTQPGVKFVTILEGINDIDLSSNGTITSVKANAIISGYQQMIAMSHEKGVKIYGATLTPAGRSAPGYDIQGMRAVVNDWIRNSSAFDGVLDFDAAIRDPLDDTKILSIYDSGDHLHPNDAGYKAMADSIDLKLF